MLYPSYNTQADAIEAVNSILLRYLDDLLDIDNSNFEQIVRLMYSIELKC